MTRFDPCWLRQRSGDESPDTVAMARLHDERPERDLKPFARRWLKRNRLSAPLVTGAAMFSERRFENSEDQLTIAYRVARIGDPPEDGNESE